MLEGLWVNELKIEYTIHFYEKEFKIYMLLRSDCRNEGYVLFHLYNYCLKLLLLKSVFLCM